MRTSIFKASKVLLGKLSLGLLSDLALPILKIIWDSVREGSFTPLRFWKHALAKALWFLRNRKHLFMRMLNMNFANT